MTEQRRHIVWTLDVADVDCPIERVSVSNIGCIVIKLRGDGGHVVREIADGLDGPTWLNLPVGISRELVIRVSPINSLLTTLQTFKGEF